MTLTNDAGFEKLKTFASDAAELLRVLGNVNRLQLLCRIAAGECSVAQLEAELDIRQPALSQQLAELRKAGIVHTRRESRSVFYSLDDARARAILETLRSLYDGASAPNAGTARSPWNDSPVATLKGDTAQFAKLRK